MLRLFLALSLALNALLAFFLLNPSSPPDQDLLFPVVKVIDGDSFAIRDPASLSGERQIRLMSVNAPEFDLCGGKEAKTELERLLSNKTVRLEGQIDDRFGRFLALVYLDDNTLVNEALIRSGWARFTSTKSNESQRLMTAFQETKAAKIGIYSPLCRQDKNPENSKCFIKGNVKDGHQIYSFPGCGSYKNSIIELDQGDRWFCTEAEAIKTGFTRAVNCPD